MSGAAAAILGNRPDFVGKVKNFVNEECQQMADQCVKHKGRV